jgi:DNA-binding LytR/AlgR family response regulator
MNPVATAIIADDEALLREDLRHKLAALWPELNIVAEAANGLQASELIEKYQPDVVFLDIKMPGRTGIEVAQGIEAATRVVFATAYDQFAVQAFEQQALDYLLKPVTSERLAQTVARLKTALAASQSPPDLRALLQSLAAQHAPPAAAHLQWIRASRGQAVHQVAVDEVLFFQSDDKYTTVLTESGQEHLIRTALSELVTQLDGQKFWQIHRSTVVAARRISHTQRDDQGRLLLWIKGHDKALVVSRAYQGLFRQM